MKRTKEHKKYAHALGQRYVAEIEDLQEELAAIAERDRKRRRQRSNSESNLVSVKKKVLIANPSSNNSAASKTFSSNDSVAVSSAVTSASTVSYTADSVATRRARARSFDDCTLDLRSPKTTLGDFSELSTRKLMTDLILTLNESFPDYDFSNVKPNQFHKLRMVDVRGSIYEKLSEFASQNASPTFLMDLWDALNDVIKLDESDVYSFEYEFDNEEEGSLWNFHYLFVNKNVRRIVLFTCKEFIIDRLINDRTTPLVVENGETITAVVQGGYDDETEVEQIRYYSMPEIQSERDDVDWNPNDNVAGGLPLELTT